MLKLLISSGGRIPGWLELPLPLDEFKRQVEKIRMEGQPDTIPAIYRVECPVPSLSWHLQQTKLDSDTTLRKLNQLAEALNGMTAAERYHLRKALLGDDTLSLEL